MIRKSISLLLVLLIVSSIMMPSKAFGTEKDYSGHWAEDTIESWLDNNYCTGYPDGTFKPEGLVTRAEFAKMVNTLFGYTELADIIFTDVKPGDWYYQEVQKAVKANYIVGVSESNFAPNEILTREQTTVIISRIMKLESNPAAAEVFTDRDEISSWAKDYVGAVAAAGLFKGYDDNSFKPQNSIKRAEAIATLDRTKKLKDEMDSINEITSDKRKDHSRTKAAVTSISAITGTPKVGVELTTGALTPTEATTNYQWKICGMPDGEYTDISGATTNKYIPVESDAGKYIRVSATGAGNYYGTVTSATTAAIAPIETYTVTFDSMGGTTMSAITGVVSGSVITLPTAPTKMWHIFAGWNTAADGSGTIFDSSTKVTADVTVYAQWNAEIYKVKFPDTGSAYIGYEDLPYGGDMDYDDIGMNMLLEETYEGGVLRKVVMEYKLLYHGAGYSHQVHINRPLKGSYTYTIDRDIVLINTEAAETTSASGIGEFDIILFDTSNSTQRTIKIEINIDDENTENTMSDYNIENARFDLDEVFKLYDPWMEIPLYPHILPININSMFYVPAVGLTEGYNVPSIIVVPLTDWYTIRKCIPDTYPDFDDYYRTKEDQYSDWYDRPL